MMRGLENQMWNTLNLAVLPRDDCTMDSFKVEQIGKYNLVFRRFHPNHGPTLSYSEGFRVGPRGAVKTCYSHTNY